MTKGNIARGFRGGGLVPFNPEAVISKLDVRLRTPTPMGLTNVDSDPWISQTPRNPTEAISQSTLVKDRIDAHQGSSPAPIFSAVKQMTMENHNLRKANEVLSKRRRAKKTRVRQGGALTIEDAQDILARKDAEEQVVRNNRTEGGSEGSQPATIRRCSKCNKPGHNTRTCQAEE